MAIDLSGRDDDRIEVRVAPILKSNIQMFFIHRSTMIHEGRAVGEKPISTLPRRYIRRLATGTENY